MNRYDEIIAALLIQAGGSVIISKETFLKIDPQAWIETELPAPENGSVKIRYCTPRQANEQ